MVRMTKVEAKIPKCGQRVRRGLALLLEALPALVLEAERSQGDRDDLRAAETYVRELLKRKASEASYRSKLK